MTVINEIVCNVIVGDRVTFTWVNNGKKIELVKHVARTIAEGTCPCCQCRLEVAEDTIAVNRIPGAAQEEQPEPSRLFGRCPCCRHGFAVHSHPDRWTLLILERLTCSHGGELRASHAIEVLG